MKPITPLFSNRPAVCLFLLLFLLASPDCFSETSSVAVVPLQVEQPVQSGVSETTVGTLERELTISKRYLLFPLKYTEEKGGKHVSVLVDGAAVREFDMNMVENPDWYAHLDMIQWLHKKVIVRVQKILDNSKVLERITQSDSIWKEDQVYSEPSRAQLHFSPRRGWNNDPNGMVYADGEYHLYFQHNPYGWEWGNMSWGHAVSKDLIHWEELPIALHAYKYGDMAYSGGAVVDKKNTSGLRTGKNSLIVATYTSTGRGQCMVYSNDKGRTFKEYSGNPVITRANRDPRPLWYEPGKCWVNVVYDEIGNERYFNFFTSPDLKSWTYQSRIPGFFECPDFFELSCEGKKLWVLTGASSDYLLGQFDGKTFTPQTPMLKGHLGRGFYAAQTFTNEPKGRIVQIGWLQTKTVNMPFNQGMSLPLELKLLTTAEGPRMTWTPVSELKKLRKKSYRIGKLALEPDAANPLAKVSGELLELRATFIPEGTATTTFDVRGITVSYSAATQQLTVNGVSVHAPLVDGRQQITVYADRTALEVFASDGLVYVPMPVFPDVQNRSLKVSVTGGNVKFDALEGYELQSIWKLPSLK